MITDSLTLLSSAQVVTATAVSTNSIDVGVAVRDLGPGEEIFVAINVDEAFATATSVNIQFISATNGTLTSGVTVLSETGTLVIAQLTLNREPIYLALPRSVYLALPIGQRYIGLRYTVAGSDATTGKFTSQLVIGPQDIKKLYPSGFTVQ